MISLGTVGSGWIVDSFLEGLARVPGIRHAAVYSRSGETAKAFAAKHGVEKTFTDLGEMARSDAVDAVYIASPNALHMEQSMLFLRHGKHVICEKSVTIKKEDSEILLKTAREQGVIFLEAIFPMHLPQMGMLEAAIKEISPVRIARFEFLQYSSKYNDFLAGAVPNIFNPALCTGSLLDLGVYCVYPAVHLFGLPKKIHAASFLLRTGADGAGCAILEYENGPLITLLHAKVGQARAESEIVGERGSITIGSVSRLENIRRWDSAGNATVLAGEGDKGEKMSWEIKSFVRYITDFENNRTEYERMGRLCCQVSGVMHEMRQASGVIFPADSE